jgi:hypothetical protein
MQAKGSPKDADVGRSQQAHRKSDRLLGNGTVRYWWVNQNQTFRQEIEGGYLWSPKRNKNGRRNPFYEFMREVAPGDIVFSFCDTRIAALGVVSGYSVLFLPETSRVATTAENATRCSAPVRAGCAQAID